jgi:putative zinc finger/helix-turn-helix YgiT family protein
MIASRRDHKYTESGLSNVILCDVEVRKCGQCGEDEVVIPAIDRLHKYLATTVANRRNALVGSEIRFLRSYLGLSAGDFAEVMGVEPETVSRWENDRRPMGAPAERVLRLIALTWPPKDDYSLDFLRSIRRERPKRATGVRVKIKNNNWEAAAR